MAYFPTASYARDRGQDNNLIAQEITILELRVLSAIANNALSTTSSDTTTVTINGTVITGSPMTNDDATGEAFYSVWKGNTESTLKSEQMREVMTHFSSKKYTIVRKKNTTTNDTFYWEISW
jgi:hypothetical protein